MINYARMQRTHKLHKSALTRAKKKGLSAVIAACRAAKQEWEAIGAWPDDWSRWQRALDDTVFNSTGGIVRLEDL